VFINMFDIFLGPDEFIVEVHPLNIHTKLSPVNLQNAKLPN
jgi:hypothetical protein